MFNPLLCNPGSRKIVTVFIYDVAYNNYLVLCKLVNFFVLLRNCTPTYIPFFPKLYQTLAFIQELL